LLVRKGQRGHGSGIGVIAQFHQQCARNLVVREIARFTNNRLPY
jgi:hypothetical protein